MLMKKILLLMCLTLITLSSSAQIMGQTTLNVEGTSTLTANFHSTNGVSIQWRVYGSSIIISSSFNNMASIKAIAPGVSSVQAVLWSINNTIIETADCQVSVNADPSAPKISGSTVLRVNSIYNFKVAPPALGEVQKWNIPKDYFDIISQPSSYEITVKTKNIIGSTAIFLNTTNGQKTMYSYLPVIIKQPSYKIETTSTVICNNDLINYTIKDLQDGDIVTWQAGSNLTLVSGQGTSTATFKGSGNGKGVVKATVTYDGIDYPIENSDVWVGVPPVPQSIIGFVANSTDPREMQVVPGQSYSFNLPEEKSTTGGQWTVKSLAQIEIPYREWVGGNGVFVDIPNMQSNGMIYMINISASNKNKCGISTPISRLLTFGTSDPRNRALMKTQGIESALSVPQPTSIRIYSYPTGSLVYQKKNTISFDIQSTNLGEGIYILEMTDQQGNVTREKVMKGKQ